MLNLRGSVTFASGIVLALTLLPSASGAQYTAPPMYPPDSAFEAVTCSDPTSIPSQDSCTDEARDHRNVVGGGTTPAYLVYNDGTYLYLRLRIEADPVQGTAFRAFAWGFGLDWDADGEFEAYITLIGQGMSDRVEVQDQDPDNGITPDLIGLPGTALVPVVSDMSVDSWAISTPAPGGNYCIDDTDGGDFYITVAVPLTVLRDFGALGSVVAYGGSSSMFSGIQNDFVCADGTPMSCTDGTTCASGICLATTGVCAPPVDPFFLGCLDEDTAPMDGIDDGCTTLRPHCVISASGSACVACLMDADCGDGLECTTDTCVSNLCVNAPSPVGTSCAGGICDGTALATSCAPCLDDASGTTTDTGCTAATPFCDTSGAVAICVGCVDDAAGGTTDSGCTAAAPLCDTSGAAPVCIGCVDDALRGTDSGCGAAAPVCDASSGTPTCVSCQDDAAAAMLDDGCAAGAPLCDTSGAAPLCVTCADDAMGGATDSGCAAGAPLCDTSGAAPICIACFDDTSGGTDSGCAAGAPACDTSGAASICVTCLDDQPAGTTDDGCSAPTAICDTSGASPVCVGCLVSADCPGSVCDAGTLTCAACVDDTVGGTDTGCGGASPVCDASGATPFCVSCEDTASGMGTDNGCAAGAPLCDTSGAAPVCVECFDDAMGTMDTGCSGSTLVCDTSGASSVCASCLDDQPAGSVDDGCAAPSPVCDLSGGAGVCVGCLEDADCGSGVCDVASRTCVTCRDDRVGMADSGCDATNPTCDTSGATPICVGCLAPTDCSAPSPVCGGSMTCVVCVDDTSGMTDTGCPATSPACDVTGSPVCLACEDTASGTGVDNGCMSGAPICDTSGGAPTCIECLAHADCPAGTPICNPANTCVPGCLDDTGCAGTSGTPVCDTTLMACVECLADTQCPGAEACDPGTNSCGPGDGDGDGIPDDVDLDDDNDGVPDVAELGGVDLSLDSDMDGIADYADATVVTCTDADADGRCDELPRSVDQDGDGVPNHLDLDADNDGIADAIEGGGVDEDADGRVDSFVDRDGDGLHDPLLGSPLALPDTDSDGLRDFLDLDDDGDGITDTREAGGDDADGDGIIDGFVDTDGDGLHDALVGSPLPRPDTDGDGTPDYLDLDADDDGLPDATEGTDGDGDGVPDVTPSGTDADGDGLDDGFDPTEGGTVASIPDHDGDGMPDYRDLDDDDDGIPTATEVRDGGTHGDDVDINTVPNWLDPDADGDGIPDGTECPPGDTCPDGDGDGVPDYLDPLEAIVDGGLPDAGPPPSGGLSGGALCRAAPGPSPRGPLALFLLVVVGALLRRRARKGGDL